MKAYVKSQPSSSPAEITTAVREMFRDVVRTAAEADVKIPWDRNGIFEPEVIADTAGTRTVWRRRFCPLYFCAMSQVVAGLIPCFRSAVLDFAEFR